MCYSVLLISAISIMICAWYECCNFGSLLLGIRPKTCCSPIPYLPEAMLMDDVFVLLGRVPN